MTADNRHTVPYLDAMGQPRQGPSFAHSVSILDSERRLTVSLRAWETTSHGMMICADGTTYNAQPMDDRGRLIADFEGTPTSGLPPLEVEFTSSPLIDADNFYWKFGDGDESAEVNPVHTYTEPGVYDVFLQVFRNVGGCLLSDSIVKAGYVDVFSCSCPYQGDMDGDGFRTALDLALHLDCVFGGGGCPADPTCPTGRCDWDVDCFCTGIDLALLIDHLFYGAPPPVDPCTVGPGGDPINCP